MIKFGNDILKVDTSWIDAIDYNPLNLPPYTIRLKFQEGVTPDVYSGYTKTQVSVSPNVWDVTRENRIWSGFLGYAKTTPPSHDVTFYNCGSNTITGAAELAQIPSDWK